MRAALFLQKRFLRTSAATDARQITQSARRLDPFIHAVAWFQLPGGDHRAAAVQIQVLGMEERDQ